MPSRKRGVASTAASASATPWTKLSRSNESWRIVRPSPDRRRGSLVRHEPGRRTEWILTPSAPSAPRAPGRVWRVEGPRVAPGPPWREPRRSRARGDRGARGSVDLAVVVQLDDLGTLEVRRRDRREPLREDRADREVDAITTPTFAPASSTAWRCSVRQPGRADDECDAVGGAPPCRGHDRFGVGEVDHRVDAGRVEAVQGGHVARSEEFGGS